MAKREILFNDEAYSIEESVIEASLAEMKSRLVDDYSGTGTTIIYDGTAISVDSAKLAAAASNLAAMLNRFAGSGANIVVNGVTYGIDSAKLNSANTKLHITLSNLQSGGGGSDNSIELDHFPLQTVTFEDYTSIYPFAQGFASFEPAPFMPLIGETYIISWDGTEYECVAKECDPETTAGYSIFFGECRDIGIIGNGEPFALGFGYVEDVRFAGFVATNSFATEHTIRIYQVATKNEYGFYFNKKYSGMLDGQKVSFVLFEDGSFSEYVNDYFVVSLPAGSAQYTDNQISVSGLPGAEQVKISNNGTVLQGEGPLGLYAVLEGANSRVIPEGAYYYNYISGQVYTEMPESPSSFDVYLYGKYCYVCDYIPGDASGMDWEVFLATSDNIYVPSDYPVTDKYQTDYGRMLSSICGAPIGGMGDIQNCPKLEIVYIPNTVRYLHRFTGCVELNTINFLGTVAQWNALGKVSDWNRDLPESARVHCLDETIEI